MDTQSREKINIEGRFRAGKTALGKSRLGKLRYRWIELVANWLICNRGVLAHPATLKFRIQIPRWVMIIYGTDMSCNLSRLKSS